MKTLVFTQIGNNACIKSLTKNYPQRLQYFFEKRKRSLITRGNISFIHVHLNTYDKYDFKKRKKKEAKTSKLIGSWLKIIYKRFSLGSCVIPI